MLGMPASQYPSGHSPPRASSRTIPRIRYPSPPPHRSSCQNGEVSSVNPRSYPLSNHPMDTDTAPTTLRCQRIGCEATFTEDDNPEGSCRYHDSAPIFHDGMKEWSCCKQRSHDFSLFLAIPGCKTGKHTKEKPVTKTAPKPKPNPTIAKKTVDLCSRCRQGFFCSDHGSQSRTVKPVSVSREQIKDSAKPVKKKVGLNDPQICRNKGCGKTFREKDNHEIACEYHPGPAIFHDRMRGWKCCDIHVKEFDEFLSIPPCTKGWHNADAE